MLVLSYLSSGFDFCDGVLDLNSHVIGRFMELGPLVENRVSLLVKSKALFGSNDFREKCFAIRNPLITTLKAGNDLLNVLRHSTTHSTALFGLFLCLVFILGSLFLLRN